MGQASIQIFTETVEICILFESIRLSSAAYPGQDATAVPLSGVKQILHKVICSLSSLL